MFRTVIRIVGGRTALLPSEEQVSIAKEEFEKIELDGPDVGKPKVALF